MIFFILHSNYFVYLVGFPRVFLHPLVINTAPRSLCISRSAQTLDSRLGHERLQFPITKQLVWGNRTRKWQGGRKWTIGIRDQRDHGIPIRSPLIIRNPFNKRANGMTQSALSASKRLRILTAFLATSEITIRRVSRGEASVASPHDSFSY